MIAFALFCFDMVSKQRKQHMQQYHCSTAARVYLCCYAALCSHGLSVGLQNCGSAGAVWPQGVEMQLSDCQTVRLSACQTFRLLGC